MQSADPDPVASGHPHPLVSVLVAVYNHARFVEACLDSVLTDGYPNVEILIVDDGSTDETRDVVEAWIAAHGRRVQVRFTSRENRGVTRSLNELLAMATGEFAVPLGSDDLLLPGGIAARVEHLRRHPRVHAVFSDCTVIDTDGRPVYASALFGYRRASRGWLRERLAEELITNWAAAGPMILYRVAAVRSIGGYDDRLLVEDWNLYLRLAARGWLEYLDLTVGAYRLHETNSHRNRSVRARHAAEARMVALEAMKWFEGRNRLALRLQSVSYASVFSGLQRGKLRHLPGRAVRLGIRAVSRLIVRLGPPSRHTLADLPEAG